MSTKTRPFSGRRAGTSLLEVLIASVILVAIMLMALVVMMNASGAAAKASISGELENRARRLLGECRTQFMTARFRDPLNILNGLGMHCNNTFLWYQIPSSGSNTGATGWGYSAKMGLNDPTGVGKSCILRFEAETVFQESTAATVASVPSDAGPAVNLPALPAIEVTTPRDVDINRDGDLLDTFVRGKIVQYVMDADLEVESTAVFDDYVMLAVVGSSQFNGDFDGLPATIVDQDYLFRWVDENALTVAGQLPGTTSRAIVVSVWHGQFSDDGKSFFVRRGSETIRFKNKQ